MTARLAPLAKRVQRVQPIKLPKSAYQITSEEKIRTVRSAMREGMKIPTCCHSWMGLFLSATEEVSHMTYVRRPVVFINLPEAGIYDTNESEVCFGGPFAENWGRIVAVAVFKNMEGGKPFWFTPVKPFELEPRQEVVLPPHCLGFQYEKEEIK